MKPIDKVYKSQDALRRGIMRLRNARAVIRESLADLIEQTLEHGSPSHLAQDAEFFPEIAHVHEERERALAVLSAWRSVDVVAGYGEDVSWVDLPCRVEAAAAAERTRQAITKHRQLRHRRAAQERAERRKAESAADVAAARAARQKERLAEAERRKAEAAKAAAAARAARQKERRAAQERAKLRKIWPFAHVTDTELLASAKRASGCEKDVVWREAKRRGWSRRQMIEAFG